MKKAFITLLALVLYMAGNAQQLKLEISNPQPRVGERFTIGVNIDTLSALFFKPLAVKLKLSESSGDASIGYPKLITNAEAAKTGKYVMGPYTLEFNGKKYTTNRISFDVVDSLPAVDNGLWIRKVKINDSTFDILIDQRVPSHAKYNQQKSSLTWSAAQDSAASVALVDSIDNIKGNGSNTSSSPGTLPGQSFMDGYSSFFGDYEFIIVDKKKPVVLHRGDFKNLPPDYKFRDIIVN